MSSAHLPAPSLPPEVLEAFVAEVKRQGQCLHRDFEWRDTRDPYAILVSEVMLQQTQVARVERFFPKWLRRFPTVDALAAAPLSTVLESWQGMGYNRRARMLKSACEVCAEHNGGQLPLDKKELLALPGIGPSTAAGVRIFAHGIPDMYLETNVRAVFLHELFFEQEGVPDRALIPLIEATCDKDDPRRWYYDLMDYGSYLKKTVPNPSRASKHHAQQSAFEGSRRQKRSLILRACLEGMPLATSVLAERLDAFERAQNRAGISIDETAAICGEMAREGMLTEDAGCWRVP
jgi:A/G-specific adenine glycosylase